MQEKLANEVNVNVLAGALKLFFRQLKEPILDHRKFQEVSPKPNYGKHATFLCGSQDIHH